MHNALVQILVNTKICKRADGLIQQCSLGIAVQGGDANVIVVIKATNQIEHAALLQQSVWMNDALRATVLGGAELTVFQ